MRKWAHAQPLVIQLSLFYLALNILPVLFRKRLECSPPTEEGQLQPAGMWTAHKIKIVSQNINGFRQAAIPTEQIPLQPGRLIVCAARLLTDNWYCG